MSINLKTYNLNFLQNMHGLLVKHAGLGVREMTNQLRKEISIHHAAAEREFVSNSKDAHRRIRENEESGDNASITCTQPGCSGLMLPFPNIDLDGSKLIIMKCDDCQYSIIHVGDNNGK